MPMKMHVYITITQDLLNNLNTVRYSGVILCAALTYVGTMTPAKIAGCSDGRRRDFLVGLVA